MNTESIDALVREKVEFNEMYDDFLSAELCEDCQIRNCGECRYNNSSIQQNGGD